MRGKATGVNAQEMRERLAELLRCTERGSSFVMQRRGKEVARLVPPQSDKTQADLAEIRAEFRKIRERVRGKVNVCAS